MVYKVLVHKVEQTPLNRSQQLPAPYKRLVVSLTSATVNNSPLIQDYTHPDDDIPHTYDMTPGFKPLNSYYRDFRNEP